MKDLEKYNKEEILTALELSFGTDSIKLLEAHLKNIRVKELTKQQELIERQTNDALNKYIDWQMEVVTKYGSNGVAKLIDLPTEQIKRGCELEKEHKKLQKQLFEIEKQLKNSI